MTLIYASLHNPLLMKCAQCGQEGRPITHYIHAETQEHTPVCMDCIVQGEIEHTSEIHEIDEELQGYEELAKDLESLILRMPERPSPSDAGFFTPLSMYEGIQNAIASLKKRRIHLLLEKDKTQRLHQQLKDALAVEDYDKAQFIKDELDEEE